MKISRFRGRFLDRFIAGDLTPEEELFALCNAYQHSKMLRCGTAYLETDGRFRHTVPALFSVSPKQTKKYALGIQQMMGRSDEDFGTRYREFIYQKLQQSNHFNI